MPFPYYSEKSIAQVLSLQEHEHHENDDHCKRSSRRHAGAHHGQHIICPADDLTFVGSDCWRKVCSGELLLLRSETSSPTFRKAALIGPGGPFWIASQRARILALYLEANFPDPES